MVAKACPEYSLNKPTTLVAISGSGNVAQHTALKLIELGATVLSLSDSKGSLISEKGFTKEFVQKIAHTKLLGGSLDAFCKESGYTYHPGKPLFIELRKKNLYMCYTFFFYIGKRPWTLIPTIHIALPGATQNEVSGEEAEALVKAGVRIVAEGSNMGCTTQAIDVFEASRKTGGVWYAPGSMYIPFSPWFGLDDSEFLIFYLNLLVEASNCGGVAVSGLEMAQNSQRLAWTSQEVDAKLKGIMAECYNVCPFSYVLLILFPIHYFFLLDMFERRI
jgi:glutamate dehydrogenase (NADP+)